MNDKEKEFIANALSEIEKVLRDLAGKLLPDPTARFENGTLFADEPETKHKREKHKICFQRKFYIKYQGKNWRSYPTLNAFIEDITQKKILRKERFHPLYLGIAPSSHQESVNMLKAKVIAFLENQNCPLTCELIARETTDGKRIQA